MTRLLRASILAAVVAAVVALTASSCSYVDPPVLAMAASSSEAPYYTLSREDMYKELNAANQTSTTKAKYSTDDTAAYLNKKVNDEFLKRFIEDHHIVVTDTDKKVAQAAAAQSSQGQQSGAEPTEQQTQLVAINRKLAEGAFASGTVDKEQKLREFYDANKSRIETPAQVCVHAIGVQAGTGTTAPTEADFATALAKATEIRKRLDTESFESVADAESKSGQSPPGGDQGCTAVTQLGDLQAPVEALADGTISQPLRTERGAYFIVRMDRHEAASLPPFDQVKDAIEVQVSQQIGQQLLKTVVGEEIRRTSVTIDPRFGAWDTSRYTVNPPAGSSEPTMPTTTTTPLQGLGVSGSGGGSPGSPGSPTSP